MDINCKVFTGHVLLSIAMELVNTLLIHLCLLKTIVVAEPNSSYFLHE